MKVHGSDIVIGTALVLGLAWGANELLNKGTPIACTVDGDGQISLIDKHGASKPASGWALSDDGEQCFFGTELSVPRKKIGPTLPGLE